MQEPYMVKGSTIRSKFEYVRDQFGDEAERDLRREFLSREGQGPLLDSSWYPFSVYDEINRAIAKRFHNGDLGGLRQAGAFSASRTLTSLYKAYVRGRSFVEFLQRIEELHKSLYSRGEMTVTVAPDGRSATILLHGAPKYSAADLEVAAGFYVGAGVLLGHTNVQCTYRKELRAAKFSLSWE